MKKNIFTHLCRITAIALVTTTMLTSNIYAAGGDMGFFGGISEGAKLPKTTATIINNSSTKAKKSATEVFDYKEVIFLSGVPYEYEGTLRVTKGAMTPNTEFGTYSDVYLVSNSASTPQGVSISRAITYNVNYRKDGAQVIKDYEIGSWKETVTTPEGVYTLDPTASDFGVSIIEDNTGGIKYYKGNTSKTAVYLNSGKKTTLMTSDQFYGYESAWSNTETHREDNTIINDDWQMQYQVRPSVSVNKDLEYSKNEPTLISFEGNYREVTKNQSGLEYTIYTKPNEFHDVEDTGFATINNYNSFEQLTAPNVDYLKGNASQEDIRKLFSMNVLTGDTSFYKPNQSVTRGQYVTMLAKALKLPITPIPTTKSRTSKATVVNIVFPDVLQTRTDYPYIMAAYENGFAVGRADGYFYADYALQRQEAIAIMLRALGLQHLGLEPTTTTTFVDDKKIAKWAKKEVSAAEKIGIISSDGNGKFRPTDYVTKAEAAAMMNRFIDYMRYDMASDYTDNIVNFAD